MVFMSFAESLISYLKKKEGEPAFGEWKLSSWRLLDSDIGYAMNLDAFFILYGNGKKEEINIVVTAKCKAGVDLLEGHTLSERDKKELKGILERLGYKGIVVQDFNE